MDDILSGRLRSTAVLLAAWHSIRRNSETSRSKATREEARAYAAALPQHLRSIQDRLRRGYKFDPARGVTPSKGKGKTGKRPLVIASIDDRVIQRAILDVLQASEGLRGVQAVLGTPTSFGGIKGKGTDDAIAMFDMQVTAGHRFVAGSDIAGFFTKVRPSAVLDILRADQVEEGFVGLVGAAMTVELSNAHLLDPEDRKLFPSGDDGVAQGCPLSALAGNVALAEFDRSMNEPGRGVTCIRYMDDFIITGPDQRKVMKAMDSAAQRLGDLGMSIYDPATDPSKAFAGPIGAPHVFLGYELIPAQYAPSPAARQKLLSRVDDLLRAGRTSIRKVCSGRDLSNQDACFAQTLVALDRVLHGWRRSFKASKAREVFEELDHVIEGRVWDFEQFFRSRMKNQPRSLRHKALGVENLAT